MGVQPKVILSGFFSKLGLPTWGVSSDRSGLPSKPSPLWNRLPQIINFARSKMQLSGHTHTLDYEPIHLHVSPAELHPLVAIQQGAHQNQATQAGSDGHLDVAQTLHRNSTAQQALVLDNFRFLLEQLPAIRTIEFSGKRHDPLENDDLAQMIDYAYKFNGAESTVYTQGFLLGHQADLLLRSQLRTLAIRLYAHRPSAYARLTGQPLQQFVTLLQRVEYLVRHKRALNASLEIEVCMTVDIHNYREIPEMVRFAEQLGVDGIRFENYLPENPLMPSDKTLYTIQKPVLRFLREVKETVVPNSRLLITLPTLLDPDMSQHRYCREPYSTVSVDAEFNISGCSRQLIFHENSGKVWDQDFFNNEMYQWLRRIFTHNHRTANLPDVPNPCRGCPRNMPAPSFSNNG